VYKDKTAENQHYVPRMLLKNFCYKNQQIYAYDKWEDRSFSTNIGNIACERNFNAVGKLDAEPFFTFLESAAKPVIDKLLKQQNLIALTSLENLILSFFIAAQYCRTKHTRETFRKINTSMAERIRAMGFDPANVEGFQELDENGIKTLSLEMIEAIPQYASLVADKRWILLKAPETNPFYISDNPVGFHNNKTFGPYGNLGFAVQGIEIYCPLSPTLTFGMYCPSIIDEGCRLLAEHKATMNTQKVLSMLGATQEIREKASTVVKTMNTFIENHPTINHSIEFLECTANGKSLHQKAENIEFANYMQVRFSNRFIYSCHNDFQLAQRIIKDHSDWKVGLMPQVG
jgi:hypothetical protein